MDRKNYRHLLIRSFFLGMRPEHTVAAYQLAIDQGADVIECDLAVTKVSIFLDCYL